MLRFNRRALLITSGLLVPLLTLVGPGLLNISGIAPAWAVLWLLPWALAHGSLSGVIAGLCQGLLLDGISLGDATQVPVLMVLGGWWGYLGRYSSTDEGSFLSYSFLAWFGSILYGISLWLQINFFAIHDSHEILINWGIYTFLAQSTLTALIAPLICSFLLKCWNRRTLF